MLTNVRTHLLIPTAFTPNNDSDNDTFGPSGLRMEKYKTYDFQIYNKWGDRIFQTNDINEWWDGNNAPAEVYNWVLVITDELGKVRKQSPKSYTCSIANFIRSTVPQIPPCIVVRLPWGLELARAMEVLLLS